MREWIPCEVLHFEQMSIVCIRRGEACFFKTLSNIVYPDQQKIVDHIIREKSRDPEKITYTINEVVGLPTHCYLRCQSSFEWLSSGFEYLKVFFLDGVVVEFLAQFIGNCSYYSNTDEIDEPKIHISLFPVDGYGRGRIKVREFESRFPNHAEVCQQIIHQKTEEPERRTFIM